MSRDLAKELGGAKGFSPTTLRYTKHFYNLYSVELQQLASCSQILPQIGGKFETENLQQVAGNLENQNNPQKALFFVRQTIENGWSRNMLLNALDTDLYERQGKAITNFTRTLPEATSDLAKEMLKEDRDNPTIGLLICKEKDNLLAQYALESNSQPIGISEFELQKLYPTNIEGTIPTIRELETKLNPALQ